MGVGDGLWPEDLEFSPDGLSLAFRDKNQIGILNIRDGAIRYPFYVTNGSASPHWSPDGTRLLYSRIGGGSEDSTGFHIYSLDSGKDIAIDHNGQPIYGWAAVWHRATGTIIVLRQDFTTGINSVVSMTPEGDSLATLAQSAPWARWEFFRRYRRPGLGLDGVLWHRMDADGEPLFAQATGEGPAGLPYPIKWFDALSENGEWRITYGIDWSDTTSVLFTCRLDDVTGLSLRQLTFWRPPSRDTALVHTGSSQLSRTGPGGG